MIDKDFKIETFESSNRDDFPKLVEQWVESEKLEGREIKFIEKYDSRVILEDRLNGSYKMAVVYKLV